MSKQKVPDNFMSDFLKSGGQPTDNQPTNNTQTPDNSSTDTVHTTHKRSTLKRYDVRFDPATWAQIQAEAHRRGLTASAMLRMIVNEWIHTEGA